MRALGGVQMVEARVYGREGGGGLGGQRRKLQGCSMAEACVNGGWRKAQGGSRCPRGKGEGSGRPKAKSAGWGSMAEACVHGGEGPTKKPVSAGERGGGRSKVDADGAFSGGSLCPRGGGGPRRMPVSTGGKA